MGFAVLRQGGKSEQKTDQGSVNAPSLTDGMPQQFPCDSDIQANTTFPQLPQDTVEDYELLRQSLLAFNDMKAFYPTAQAPAQLNAAGVSANAHGNTTSQANTPTRTVSRPSAP